MWGSFENAKTSVFCESTGGGVAMSRHRTEFTAAFRLGDPEPRAARAIPPAGARTASPACITYGGEHQHASVFRPAVGHCLEELAMVVCRALEFPVDVGPGAGSVVRGRNTVRAWFPAAGYGRSGRWHGGSVRPGSPTLVRRPARDRRRCHGEGAIESAPEGQPLHTRSARSLGSHPPGKTRERPSSPSSKVSGSAATHAPIPMRLFSSTSTAT